MIWNDEELNKLKPDARNRVMETMRKYGDNKWWESDDPIVVAKGQIFENVLMIDFTECLVAAKVLLGRQVCKHEFCLNLDSLRNEAKAAIYSLNLTTI